MLTEILAILGSGPIGAIIGGGLAYLNRKTDLEKQRLDHAHEQARWGHDAAMRGLDLEQTRAEAAGRREVAIIEGEATAEAARLAAVAQAQASDRVGADELAAAGRFGRWLLVLVVFVQRIIRPLLTAALVGVALWLNIELLMLIRGETWAALPVGSRRDIALQALAWTTAQASACIQYWMVARGTGR